MGQIKTKYIVVVLTLALLTYLVVSNSLLPWMRQHDLRSAENYRLLAERSAMEGSIAESETFYRAALIEAQKLGDKNMFDEISQELKVLAKIKSDQAEKLQHREEPGGGRAWLWQSLIGDSSRAARNRKYMKRWTPVFTIAFQREQTLAVNDPTRLVELGDWQLELLHVPYAELLYRKASALALRQNDMVLEVQIRDRLAHVAYVNQNYDQATQDLNGALALAQKHQQNRMIPIIVAHQAQVYLEVNQPQQAIALCKKASKMEEVANEPFLKWYINLLLGQGLSLAGKHDEAITCLKQCELQSEQFFPGSSAKQRVCRTLAEASLESGRLKEAETYFYKLIDLTSKKIPETSIDYEYKLLDEAALYRELKKHKQDLFLCEMVVRSREARVGKNGKGLRRILNIQREAFRNAGDNQKAQEIQLRIERLNSTTTAQ